MPPIDPKLILAGKSAYRLGKAPAAPYQFAPLAAPTAGADSLPVVPSKHDWARSIAKFSDLGNLQWGDCVASTIGNIVRTWNTVAGHAFTPTANQALQYYSQISGFRRTVATDNGAFMIDGIARWKSVGFAGHTIWGYSRLNPLDLGQLARSIYLFGPINAGFMLPSFAAAFVGPRPDQIWDVLSIENEVTVPGSWGGHALMITGYDLVSNVFTAITWGKRQFITFGFIQRYCDEVYAMVSRDWLTGNGKSPSKLGFPALRATLSAI